VGGLFKLLMQDKHNSYFGQKAQGFFLNSADFVKKSFLFEKFGIIKIFGYTVF